MNRRLLNFCIAAVSLLCVAPGSHAQVPDPAAHKPVIILKLDDFGSNPPGWKTRVIDFLVERKIKASFGFVCQAMERAGEDPHRYDLVREWQRSGQFEFWLHGYDHMEWVDDKGFQHNEMDARPVEEVKRRFDLCQDIAMHRLGFYFRTIGPPGGGPLPKGVTPGISAKGRGFVSSETYQAVQDDPHLKIWLYGSALDKPGADLAAKGKVIVLDRDLNLENPTFVPNPEVFKAGWEKASRRDYLVLQGHPMNWTPERFAKFVEIIDFLTAQGVTFTTPSEYCHLPPLEVQPTDGIWMPAPATPPLSAQKP